MKSMYHNILNNTKYSLFVMRNKGVAINENDVHFNINRNEHFLSFHIKMMKTLLLVDFWQIYRRNCVVLF